MDSYVKYKRRAMGKCDDCGKWGFLNEVWIIPNVNQGLCDHCFQEWKEAAEGDEPLKTPCPRCGGSGLSWGEDCDFCDGHGYLWWE